MLILSLGGSQYNFRLNMLVFTNRKGRVHLQNFLDKTIADTEPTPSAKTDHQEMTDPLFKPR